MSTVKEQLTEKIKQIIETKTCLHADEHGHFYGEIYVDYRDELCDSTIRKLFDSRNPYESFYDFIDSGYMESEWSEHGEIMSLIKRELSADEDDESAVAGDALFNEYESFINDWVCENVYFNFPYDHYLNQDVCIDVIVDTGDGNYDFTLNNFFNFYADRSEDREISEKSSLVWLMKQQGYSMEQITAFIVSEDSKDSKFLESVLQESMNCSTSMAALTFFVKMTLKEAFELHGLLSVGERGRTLEEYRAYDAKIAAREGNIIFDKGTTCGLYDPWGGSGGCLEIDVENDVVLPLKYISSALPDGCRGYGANSIYGICSSFWTDGATKLVA